MDPMWSLLMVGIGCILGRVPRTKETLFNFHEWCRVTRHPRIFRRLTGCQRDPWEIGRHKNNSINLKEMKFGSWYLGQMIKVLLVLNGCLGTKWMKMA